MHEWSFWACSKYIYSQKEVWLVPWYWLESARYKNIWKKDIQGHKILFSSCDAGVDFVKGDRLHVAQGSVPRETDPTITLGVLSNPWICTYDGNNSGCISYSWPFLYMYTWHCFLFYLFTSRVWFLIHCPCAPISAVIAADRPLCCCFRPLHWMWHNLDISSSDPRLLT